MTSPADLAAQRIAPLLQRQGLLLAALDGRCAAGKTTLASLLASRFGGTVVHIDDYFLPRERRAPGWLTQPGGNIDFDRLQSEVLLPLSKGQPALCRPFCCRTQRYAEPFAIAPQGLVLIEGAYACHPALREFYALRFFLDVEKSEQARRIRLRNREGASAFFETWIPLEERYFAACRPAQCCDVIFRAENKTIRPTSDRREKSEMEKAKVYFTKEISAEALLRLYDSMGASLRGKTAVKISTGEPGGHNFLNPALIAPLVNQLSGTIVECNTAYEGKRYTSKDHWQAIRDHGFLDIAPCDIMDEEGEIALPVRNGFHLTENYVGSHLANYDSMLMLSHFKGHAMGGFGGALKNMSIGVASSHGKAVIHGAGDPKHLWDADHDSFLESMADADQSVMNYMGTKNMAYLSVANRLSVDCDCDSNPEEPKMADIGMFASLDPVALDQACVDAVYASEDPGKSALIERMESRHGIHTVEAAVRHGLGTREYELICID